MNRLTSLELGRKVSGRTGQWLDPLPYSNTASDSASVIKNVVFFNIDIKQVPTQVWNGSSWDIFPVRYWNGSVWEQRHINLFYQPITVT